MRPNVFGRCGDRIDDDQPDDGPLVMTGSFPARVGAGGDNRFVGTVTVTNRADVRVSGTTASEPAVFLTESGRIVATPVSRDDVGVLLDLAPAARHVFDATASLLRCTPAGGNRPDEHSLSPGRYAVHAVLTVVGGTPRDDITVIGGPWLVDVT